jgi:serpin B
VIHKAFVETNEEGTEAAAATGAVMKPTSAAPDPETPFTFRADRPFLFVIRDTPTGTPVFVGRVVNPMA